MQDIGLLLDLLAKSTRNAHGVRREEVLVGGLAGLRGLLLVDPPELVDLGHPRLRDIGNP